MCNLFIRFFNPINIQYILTPGAALCWDNHGVVELPLGGARGPHLFLQPRLDFVPVRFFFVRLVFICRLIHPHIPVGQLVAVLEVKSPVTSAQVTLSGIMSNLQQPSASSDYPIR